MDLAISAEVSFLFTIFKKIKKHNIQCADQLHTGSAAHWQSKRCLSRITGTVLNK